MITITLKNAQMPMLLTMYMYREANLKYRIRAHGVDVVWDPEYLKWLKDELLDVQYVLHQVDGRLNRYMPKGFTPGPLVNEFNLELVQNSIESIGQYHDLMNKAEACKQAYLVLDGDPKKLEEIEEV